MQSIRNLDGPYNGLQKKIDFIRSCFHSTLTDTRIRSFAEAAAGSGNRIEQARNLYNAIRAKLDYLPDPVGVEMTKSPSVMLDEISNRGKSAGDCDDHACLNYTMLQVIGIPAKLRVTWYGGAGMPQHIYALANIQGRDIPFDTTRKAGFGTEAPYKKKMDF